MTRSRSRFRFSLAGMSAFVLAAGIVFAAARSPTEAWANGAFSLAMLVLGVAVLGAMFRRGPARAYWAGFAIMGGAYLMLAFGPWCDSRVAPLLITKTLGELLHHRFGASLPERPHVRPIPGANLVMFGHQQMIHSLTSLLLGLLGGATAVRIAAAGDTTPPDPPPNAWFRQIRMRPRDTLAALAAVAMVGAAALAAIRPPGELVANGTLSAAMLAVGLAAIGALFLRGRARAPWAGFVLMGGGYLVLVLGPWCDSRIAPLLITETALKALQERHGPYPVTQVAVRDLGDQVRYAPRQIGHALASVLVGLIGAATARSFAASPAPPRASHPPGRIERPPADLPGGRSAGD